MAAWPIVGVRFMCAPVAKVTLLEDTSWIRLNWIRPAGKLLPTQCGDAEVFFLAAH